MQLTPDRTPAQYASHCFCDNEYGQTDGLGPAPEAECNMACRAEPDRMCGGSWRNSVYEIMGRVPAPAPFGDVSVDDFTVRGSALVQDDVLQITQVCCHHARSTVPCNASGLHSSV